MSGSGHILPMHMHSCQVRPSICSRGCRAWHIPLWTQQSAQKPGLHTPACNLLQCNATLDVWRWILCAKHVLSLCTTLHHHQQQSPVILYALCGMCHTHGMWPSFRWNTALPGGSDHMTIACLEYKKYMRGNILNTKQWGGFLTKHIFVSLFHCFFNLAKFCITR